ncbi:hypothetical protein LR48_Vigan818s001400 [Vigna angularis]|uniref:Uncharacterized protein n=1 Tax=Phaseolus angularis TaxID=3914 RepID=A0A0L9TH55_PHAAN|nr:hypothetical protein LR48_Vigan818s001400 [Vigna angularis]
MMENPRGGSDGAEKLRKCRLRVRVHTNDDDQRDETIECGDQDTNLTTFSPPSLNCFHYVVFLYPDRTGCSRVNIGQWRSDWVFKGEHRPVGVYPDRTDQIVRIGIFHRSSGRCWDSNLGPTVGAKMFQ